MDFYVKFNRAKFIYSNLSGSDYPGKDPLKVFVAPETGLAFVGHSISDNNNKPKQHEDIEISGQFSSRASSIEEFMNSGNIVTFPVNDISDLTQGEKVTNSIKKLNSLATSFANKKLSKNSL